MALVQQRDPVTVVDLATADVAVQREANRRRRLRLIALALSPLVLFLWYRILRGEPFNLFQLPHVDPLLLMSERVLRAC